MTEEPTDFQYEHETTQDEFLENFYRLPKRTREAIALIVRELVERYKNYQ